MSLTNKITNIAISLRLEEITKYLSRNGKRMHSAYEILRSIRTTNNTKIGKLTQKGQIHPNNIKKLEMRSVEHGICPIASSTIKERFL